MQYRASLAALFISALLLAGCASGPVEPTVPEMRPDVARALIVRSLPPGTSDAQGWATDIYAAFATLGIAVTPANICSVVAIAEQESGFRVDPAVPNLAAITWAEIDRRADRAGVPRLVVRTAMRLGSPNGKSYGERIDAARTERELSQIFEDFIGMAPMGKSLFGGYNPIRTGGPMQVSVSFAEALVAAKPYPYKFDGEVRHEVFTRRGGLYFGIAHLLDYPATYDAPIYRFADYNAGRHASRNAALQNAISVASGVPLALDGDLIAHDDDASRPPGSTELAARVLATRIKLSTSEIRSSLERGDKPDLDRTPLHARVFELADRLEGAPLPRAIVPTITLNSPKITRKLTTEWFAKRANERYQRCLARGM